MVLSVFVALGAFCGKAQAFPRPTLSLDGTWRFATDPEDVGEAQEWYLPSVSLPSMPLPGYAPEANGAIQVPGIWDNQGYGTETDRLRHNMPGKGWYRRTVRIPASWRGQRIFLCVGGVHRYAKTWVEGHYLGEHIGFLSTFEYDLTDIAEAGSTVTIVIQVDSRQRWEVDAMYGAGNLADYMMIEWGGIWGHVQLEARDEAWLSELFVRPNVTASRCGVSATLNGQPGYADHFRLEVLDRDGHSVATRDTPLPEAVVAGQTVETSVRIPEAKLWSPDQPYVYQARLSLLRGDEVIDTVGSGFGMREIAIDGARILLNGKRLMLRGYGDDHIYPKEMAFSLNKEMYLERLRVIKSYGFNHVRHHSTIMPDEYYEACDEVGIMPTAEFPIVYSAFLPGTGSIWQQHVPEGTGPEPAVATYKREWAAAITRHRNHPSLLCWVMGNELWEGIPLRHEFQRIVRELDPTRPFADSDGLGTGLLQKENDRDTLDLYFVMFNVWSNPIDLPEKFHSPEPLKPVISHETGNYVTFTRPDTIGAFKHNVKPYWLTPAVERLEELGYLDEADLWAEKSEYLYMLCHKYNIEALRKNPYLSGHHWWLFQDYWTSSNGIVDFYFRPKAAITGEDVRKIVNDVVLLQDGLTTTYRGATDLSATLSVSDFSMAPHTRASAELRITLGEEVIHEQTITPETLEQGAVTPLGDVAIQVPDVSVPTPLKLEATLTLDDRVYRNDWSARVYPAICPPPDLDVPVYASRGALPYCEGGGAQVIPKRGTLSEHAVYVAGAFDTRMVDAVEKGACLVMVGDGAGLLPTWPATFRTTWWKAGHGDGFVHFPVNYSRNNCGTLVYDHPVTRAMAPEGWCDDGWYALIQDGRQFVLENVPARPNVIIRALPGLAAVQDKAMLFEVRVGEGRLIASGLNHEKGKGSPAHQWLFARMLEHATAGPRPETSWPVSMLRVCALPSGPYLTGFRKLLSETCERGQTRSYRGVDVEHYICRQTEAGTRLTWAADPMPTDWDEDKLVYVFAGGFGWHSEPRTDGFRFWLNEKPCISFNLPEDSRTWVSDDGQVKLRYESKWNNTEDWSGLFYLEVANSVLTPGEPVQFSVESMGSGSRRWLALAPYADLGL